MRVFASLILSVSALLMVITASCSIRENGPEVQIAVGEVSLRRDGKTMPLSAGIRLKIGDSLTLAQNSKIKIKVGSSSVYVNENTDLRLTQTTGADKLALAVHRGELHFVIHEGDAVTCRAGDAFISITNADAALTASPFRQTAQVAVLKGEISVHRSGEETRVASCTKALIESAGLPQTEVILTDELERLIEWVGKSVIEKSVASAGCRPMTAARVPETLPTAEVLVRSPAEEAPQEPALPPPVAPVALKPQTQTVTQVSEAPPKPAEPDTKPEPKPAPAAPNITIDYLSGPRQAFAGQDVVFKCNISFGVPAEFVWRFKRGKEITEKRSPEPHVNITLEKTGDYTVICDVIGEKGGSVSQQIALKIVNSPVIADAGGPYKTFVNNPVKLKGSGQSQFSNIVLYEWYVSGSQTAVFSSATPSAFDHTFTQTGKQRVILKVSAANGTTGSDTVFVDVSSQPPEADAGEDIVSKSGRKVRLRGTGTVPGGGEITKFEWDFDGDGVFEWSSAASGVVQRVFNSFSTPILRVTNSMGASAADTARVVICPKGMVTSEKGKFCIDEYEWPNSRGTVPHTNMSWHEAAAACESVGKRLCEASEWQTACRNDKTQKQAGYRAFPYGMDFDENRCNTLGNVKTKNRLSESGEYPDCGGPLSIFDMSGNAAEWVNSHDGATAPVYGGFYQSRASESNCDSRVTLEKNKNYFYTGFRCCK